MKKYEITQEQLDSVLKYLYGRPFAEVYQGINVLSTIPEIKAVESAPTAPTELKAVESAPASS